MKKDGNLIFPGDGAWSEEGAIVTPHLDGVRIAVSEERAVDSYNQSFECTVTLTRDEVIELRDYLNTLLTVDS